MAIAAVGLLGASVVGLATRDDPAPAGPAAPGEVQIAGFAFGPEALQVAVGTTVTWANSDTADHTVDATDGDELSSGSIREGETFEHLFDTAGTYSYLCAFHPFMVGTVEVTG